MTCPHGRVPLCSQRLHDLPSVKPHNISSVGLQPFSRMANLGHRRMIMEMNETVNASPKRPVWNAGRAVGAKRALKPKQIWEIRFYLNQRHRLRDRALFDLAIDSELRGCDLDDQVPRRGDFRIRHE